MNSIVKYDIIIIGGGLAGLIAALHLSTNKNLKIALFEKNKYPHHKVCGEYISNEVIPYLKRLEIDPFEKGSVAISEFEISTHRGKKINSPLPMGGFGISRYTLDNYLFQSIKEKVSVYFNKVEEITFKSEVFTIKTTDKLVYTASYVIGAFGKRSLLDTFLKRKFIQKKSPWLAVKSHYRYNQPNQVVSLHNFEGGYCGISKVENNRVNVCYLTTFKSFKKIGDIDTFQKEIMCKNPNLKHFFDNATTIFDKPLSISQISFEQKNAVEAHIFMVGDSAGLIHPLCGNGMAMAIHSAKLCSETLLKVFEDSSFDRLKAEKEYQLIWNKTFSKRVQTGRFIQKILLNPIAANIGFKLAKLFPSILPQIIKKTHGDTVI
jgi:flavin-dependent dehydrogenase